jgi:transcriptional regulator
MYIPPLFKMEDKSAIFDAIEVYSFGLLVSPLDGQQIATHLPFLLDRDRGPNGTLLGHLARENPHRAALLSGAPSLAIFQGPHAYISPSWYLTHPSVPTWNYLAVHAYGRPKPIEDASGLRALLTRLVAQHEAKDSNWRMEALPESFLAGMLRGIIGFEIEVERLEGKAKMSQNRPAKDRPEIVAALEARDSGDDAAVAVFVRKGSG